MDGNFYQFDLKFHGQNGHYQVKAVEIVMCCRVDPLSPSHRHLILLLHQINPKLLKLLERFLINSFSSSHDSNGYNDLTLNIEMFWDIQEHTQILAYLSSN